MSFQTIARNMLFFMFLQNGIQCYFATDFHCTEKSRNILQISYFFVLQKETMHKMLFVDKYVD